MSRSTRSAVAADPHLQAELERNIRRFGLRNKRTQTDESIFRKLADIAERSPSDDSKPAQPDESTGVTTSQPETSDQKSDHPESDLPGETSDHSTSEQSSQTSGRPEPDQISTPSESGESDQTSDHESDHTSDHTDDEENFAEAILDLPDSSTPPLISATEQQSNMSAEETLRTLLSGMEHTKAQDPGKFGGLLSEDANTWLEHFETFAKIRKYDEAAKIEHMSLYMTGIAALWFRNLCKETQKDTWAHLSEAFKEAYINDKSYLIQKIENTRMSTFKSSEQYINHIVSMCNKAGITEKDMVPHLERGLPAEIKKMVLAHRSKNLADCIDTIYRSETIIDTIDKPEAEVKALAADKQLTTIADAITNLTEKLEQLEKASKSHSNNGNRGNNRGGYRGGYRQNYRVPECYNCGKRGHMSYECYSNPNRSNSRGNHRGRGRGRGRGGNNYSGNSGNGGNTGNQPKNQ